jgi:hypothetical protein
MPAGRRTLPAAIKNLEDENAQLRNLAQVFQERVEYCVALVNSIHAIWEINRAEPNKLARAILAKVGAPAAKFKVDSEFERDIPHVLRECTATLHAAHAMVGSVYSHTDTLGRTLRECKKLSSRGTVVSDHELTRDQAQDQIMQETLTQLETSTTEHIKKLQVHAQALNEAAKVSSNVADTTWRCSMEADAAAKPASVFGMLAGAMALASAAYTFMQGHVSSHWKNHWKNVGMHFISENRLATASIGIVLLAFCCSWIPRKERELLNTVSCHATRYKRTGEKLATMEIEFQGLASGCESVQEHARMLNFYSGMVKRAILLDGKESLVERAVEITLLAQNQQHRHARAGGPTMSQSQPRVRTPVTAAAPAPALGTPRDYDTEPDD